MDLKQRKNIYNTKTILPHYLFGRKSSQLIQWMLDELNELKESGEADIDPNLIESFLDSGVSDKGLFNKDNIKNAAGKGVAAVAQAAAVPVANAVSGLLSGGKESATGDIIGDVGAAGLGAAGTAIGGPIGGTIGSVVGKGIGGIFTGLFGSDPEEERQWLLLQEENKRVQKAALDWNSLFREQKQLAYDKKYGYLKHNTLVGSGAGFKYGKPSGVNPVTGETYKKYNVNTAYGKVNDTQNAWVSKGEWIWDKQSFPHYTFGKPGLFKVKNGPNDTASAHLNDGDVVFSKIVRNPETGNPVAEDVPMYAKHNALDQLEFNLELAKSMNNYKYDKSTGLRKMDLGGLFNGNLFSTLFSMDAARKQYRMANEALKRTNVYEPNRQFGAAMSDLDALYLPYHPFALQNLATERRLANNIKKSAGLSAGQKARAYSLLNYDTQKNNSATLMLNMLQNNTYRAAAAQARMAAGQDAAKMRMQANMFDEEMLAKAHNAAVQGKNMALFNTINAMQQYYANQFKKNQFDRTLALYQLELDERAKDRQTLSATTNVVPTYSMYNLPMMVNQGRNYYDSLFSRPLDPRSIKINYR